jgi:hypothetical protein
MSKTDKTRPFRAQVPDSPRARHDHSNGVCDLPTLEEWRKMSRKAIWRTNCTWEPANWQTYKGFGRSKGERFWNGIDRDRKEKAKRGKDDYDY